MSGHEIKHSVTVEICIHSRIAISTSPLPWIRRLQSVDFAAQTVFQPPPLFLSLSLSHTHTHTQSGPAIWITPSDCLISPNVWDVRCVCCVVPCCLCCQSPEIPHTPPHTHRTSVFRKTFPFVQNPSLRFACFKYPAVDTDATRSVAAAYDRNW